MSVVGTCSGIGANIEQWDRKDRTPYSVFCPVGNVATRHPLSAEGATVALAGHSVLFARRDTPVFQEIDAKAGKLYSNTDNIPAYNDAGKRC